MTSEAQRLVVDVQHELILQNVVGVRLSAALTELQDWICLPTPGDPRFASGQLGEFYFKEFPDNDTLIAALVGHQLASGQRMDEERLAFSVLKNWEKYEIVLDPLLTRLVDAVLRDGKSGTIYNWTSYYGPAAELSKLPWQQAVTRIRGEEKLDRLYKKVAFIHDFARAKIRFQTDSEKTTYNSKRSAHSAMRKGKSSLNETHSVVMSDRIAGQSVWGGTSGSTMDMINVAMRFGIADHLELTHLAWAIFAFFHFMPTVKSPTHTFIEVMRGAESLIGAGNLSRINTSSANRPPTDIAAANA